MGCAAQTVIVGGILKERNIPANAPVIQSDLSLSLLCYSDSQITSNAQQKLQTDSLSLAWTGFPTFHFTSRLLPVTKFHMCKSDEAADLR